MPNWCCNKVVLIGEQEDINKALEGVKNDEGNLFDFNKLIPMPDTVRATEHGSMSFASEAVALYLKEGITNNHLQWLMERHDIKNTKKLTEVIKQWQEEKKVDLEMGNRILENREKYGGCGDWYEWAIENWGTKWDVDNATVDENRIFFDTAWSPAVPVIEKLSALNPNLTIEYKYFEGGIGLAGEEIYQEGECKSMEMFDVGEPKYMELCKEFGGEDCD